MDGLKTTKRNLPHWILKDSVFFITFNTLNTSFNTEEIKLVTQHIIDGNEKFYDLYAAVVMDNHVHVILKPVSDYSLSRIMKGIKGVSANKINKIRILKDSFGRMNHLTE